MDFMISDVAKDIYRQYGFELRARCLIR
ncbi:hypothetical protein [Sphingobacterium suaedae]|uniref:Uncharacterized protein n=1 Tax=Sphingobacterium suaedae TaxID=1686402 RepID=A0ABW5KJC6_9SPHI